MSCDLDVTNESTCCWEKNSCHITILIMELICRVPYYTLSLFFFFNRDNLLPVTVVGLLLHLLVTYGVTNKPFIVVSQGKPFKNYVIVHVCPFILNAFTDQEESFVLLLRNMPVNPDKRKVCYWQVLYFHAVSLCLPKNSLHKLCVLAASSNWLQDAVNDFGHRWVVQA